MRRSSRAPHRLTRLSAVIVIATIATSFATSAKAQVIRGLAVDSVSREPISGALVSFVDSTANLLGIVRTSDQGRFTLKAKESGYYALELRSIGFKRLVSPWIPLASTDTVEVTLRVVRNAVTLSSVVVKAERDAIRDRPFMGLSFKAMSAQIITPSEIDAVRGSIRGAWHSCARGDVASSTWTACEWRTRCKVWRSPHPNA
jgi:hypothetical protein